MATEQISFRLSKDLLETIDFLAVEQLRTRSNMIEFMLTSWIREHAPHMQDDEDDKYMAILKKNAKRGGPKKAEKPDG